MKRRPIPPAVSARISKDLTVARAGVGRHEPDAAWRALEEAHILSQPWAWQHVKVHGAMLQLAWRSRNRREVTGQVVRLVVAGPGSLLGRYPVGNTGRSTVPINQAMPVPPELAALLGDAR